MTGLAKTGLIVLWVIALTGEFLLVPMAINETVAQFVELEGMRLALFVGEFGLFTLAEGLLLCLWKLLSLSREDRFSPRVFRWTRLASALWIALAGSCLVFLLTCQVSGYAPPALMFGLVGATALFVVATIATRVGEQLLKKALVLQGELAEVI